MGSWQGLCLSLLILWTTAGGGFLFHYSSRLLPFCEAAGAPFTMPPPYSYLSHRVRTFTAPLNDSRSTTLRASASSINNQASSIASGGKRGPAGEPISCDCHDASRNEQQRCCYYDNKPFCCPISSSCCGSSCCPFGGQCCRATDFSGRMTCCAEDDTCTKQGTCASSSSSSSSSTNIISLLPLLSGASAIVFILCCCLCICVSRIRHQRRTTRRNTAPTPFLINATTTTSGYGTFPEGARQGIPSRTSAYKGVPPAILHSFPVQTYQKGCVPFETASCRICLCEYEPQEQMRLLPCNHHFHCTCIDRWLLSHDTCPLCVQSVLSPSSVSSSTTTLLQPSSSPSSSRWSSRQS
ncbi:RING/U-box superfamily protein [Balamuthia mandrillaris]